MTLSFPWTLVALCSAVACSNSSFAPQSSDALDAGNLGRPDASNADDASTPVIDASSASDGSTTATRAAAAKATAESATNACSSIGPFYWEIGDKAGLLASGSVNVATSPDTYDATTVMPIASASKWLYSAYYLQRRAGVLTDEDSKFLTFRSGYTNFSLCLPGDTVESCDSRGTNGTYSASTDGYFYYDGGHMQKHATLNGLGAMDNAALAAEIRSQLGTEIELTYVQPQLAGGVSTNATEYAKFLRKILNNELVIASVLGSHAVCTNPKTCAEALSTPAPDTADVHYSLGHWVEDDPVTGDGSFSSAGAFGFYPWVDATKTLYGIVARKAAAGSNAGWQSLECGRLIRMAWKTGESL
jgi:hypothetical protein